MECLALTWLSVKRCIVVEPKMIVKEMENRRLMSIMNTKECPLSENPNGEVLSLRTCMAYSVVDRAWHLDCS